MRENLMGDSIKDLFEVQLDNLHCSSLSYQSSHLIVEDHRFGQTRLSPHESMLKTHDYLLVCHGNCFRIIYSIIFPEIEVKQTNLWFLAPFLSFSR